MSDYKMKQIKCQGICLNHLHLKILIYILHGGWINEVACTHGSPVIDNVFQVQTVLLLKTHCSQENFFLALLLSLFAELLDCLLLHKVSSPIMTYCYVNLFLLQAWFCQLAFNLHQDRILSFGFLLLLTEICK